jgi:hypothetical protein
MTRDVKSRLGCGRSGEDNIKALPFFESVDWDKLARLEVEPPIKPKSSKGAPAVNFDHDFTTANPVLTPTDQRMIVTIDQRPFKGFSFVNPAPL